MFLPFSTRSDTTAPAAYFAGRVGCSLLTGASCAVVPGSQLTSGAGGRRLRARRYAGADRHSRAGSARYLERAPEARRPLAHRAQAEVAREIRPGVEAEAVVPDLDGSGTGVPGEAYPYLRGPGGVYLMQDIAGSSHVHNNLDHLLGPLMYTISTMHCMTVSLAQGGAGLGAMWGKEKAEEMLREAGFANVRVEQLPHDFINNYYISRRG